MSITYCCLLCCVFSAVSNRSMRLFVIGHSQKGKSTILRTLKGDKLTKDMLTKVVTLERRQPDRERENGKQGEREREREIINFFFRCSRYTV